MKKHRIYLKIAKRLGAYKKWAHCSVVPLLDLLGFSHVTSTRTTDLGETPTDLTSYMIKIQYPILQLKPGHLLVNSAYYEHVTCITLQAKGRNKIIAIYYTLSIILY